MHLGVIHLLRKSFYSFLIISVFIKLSEENMHSSILSRDYGSYMVKTIPALFDNFMYLVVDKTTKGAFAVDPVSASTMMDEIRKENATLKAIFTTHHHSDHSGGNIDLKELAKRHIDIYGGDNRIPALTSKLTDGSAFNIDSINIKCFHTPCHTTGHLCYYLTSNQSSENPGHGAVFTGDTLFIGGCGRFFEGTASEMNSSLNKLAALPDNTDIYCGHEYTVSNLKFAKTVEPQNTVLGARLQEYINLREKNQPTVPSTIGNEKQINPFMRAHLPEVQKYTKSCDLLESLQTLRDNKNNFKG